MNRQELQKKVKQIVHQLIHQKNEASPLELFIRMNKISPELVEEWRRGKLPYLEKGLHGNLAQFSFIMKEFRKTAQEMELRETYRSYSRSGKGPQKPLRFSKSGDAGIERRYATHYVRSVQGVSQRGELRSEVSDSSGGNPVI